MMVASLDCIGVDAAGMEWFAIRADYGRHVRSLLHIECL
jgi:hypothetical protein